MREIGVSNTIYFPKKVNQSNPGCSNCPKVKQVVCSFPKACFYLRGESPLMLLKERDYLRKRVDEMEEIFNMAQKEITDLRQENKHLKEEIVCLREAISQVQASPLKRLITKRQDSDEIPRKRGAPLGHPGTSRKRPQTIDEYVIVSTEKCPTCGNTQISASNYFDEHIQEDIVIIKPITRCFIHFHYWCPHCKKIVSTYSQNEIPKAPLGPIAKSVASYLHHHIKISYDDIQKIFSNLFGLRLSPASLVGFDNKIYQKGLAIYGGLKKLLPYTSNINADETSWKKS